jgi:hypothetical protein
MLAGPFPAEAVIARLQTLAALRVVGGAAALEQALKVPPRAFPAAFVVTRESGQKPADYTDAYAQPMSVDVIVVLWVSHAGSQDNGAAAAAAMSQLEREVRTCLRGWSPTNPFEPLFVRASGQDQYTAGQQLRQVVFSTEYRDQEIGP